MRAEVIRIQKRITSVSCECFGPIAAKYLNQNYVISSENRDELDAGIQELGIIKVRLENLLCETDIKEQDHLLIVETLKIEHFFSSRRKGFQHT